MRNQFENATSRKSEKRKIEAMIKLLAILLFGLLATPSSAHDTISQDRKNLAWLSEMARLNAQKACTHRSDSNRPLCESEQIRWLAQTAAALPILRPASISPAEFAGMIENLARAKQREAWPNNFIEEAGTVDCRINVC